MACSVPRLGFLLCGLFLIAPGALGEEPSPVRAMIEESGMVEELDLISQMYRIRLLDTGRVGGLPSESAEALARIGARAMESARFIDDLETELSGTLSNDRVDLMLDFYRSPLGRKIKRLEAQAFTVRQRADIQSHRTEFQLELSQVPNRKRQFERIDQHRLMSELSAAVTGSLIYAVAAAGLADGERGVSKDALDALDAGVAAMHDTLLHAVQEETGAILLNSYRRLSDKDLDVYAAFLETEEAQAAYVAILTAANAILQAREHEIAMDFFAAVKRDKN